MRVAPNFDAKALSLSGEDFSVLARHRRRRKGYIGQR
jgi:hypothetical protein